MTGGQRNKRLNTLLVLAIVLVAVASLVGLRLWLGAGSGDASASGMAHVTDGDGNVLELPLDADTVETVTTSLGTNVIEVREGRVRVREADCPHQDCVEQGWIDSPSQEIVCLPHRLYVDVVGGVEPDIDVVGR